MPRRRLLFPLLTILVVALGSLIATLATDTHPQLGLDLQGGASVTFRPVGNYAPEALNEIPNIFRSRIDSLGVAEPEIIRQGDTIVVNLPGVTDTDQALALVSQTGTVLFRPVLSRLDTGQKIDFSKIGQGGTTVSVDPAVSTSIVQVGAPTTVVATDASASPSTDASAAPATDASATTAPPVSASAAGIVKPKRQTGTTTTAAPSSEAPTTTASSDTTLAGGASDTTAATDTTVPGETTTTVAGGPTTTAAPIAVESVLTPIEQDTPDAQVWLPDRDGLGVIYNLGPAFAFGESAIDSASARVNNGQWEVELVLKGGAGGLDAWNQWAAKCYQHDAECPDGGMAIVLDHRVISAPAPQTPQFDSTSVAITGNFKEKDAANLARVLNYGATPVELKAEAAQTVSATLGKDSLRAGLIAGAIGVALVLLFMLFYYRSLAVVVVAGLCVSGALLWSVISLLSRTNGLALTLAGVTGIIVSVGVTVDSYVVFFERLKDEVKSGKSFRSSAARGFSAAWKTILAADIVSLIGALVLWKLSVGSVRGFAFFLGLSTLSDLVVAWFFTRPAVLLLSRGKRFQQGHLLGVEAAPAVAGGAS